MKKPALTILSVVAAGLLLLSTGFIIGYGVSFTKADETAKKYALSDYNVELISLAVEHYTHEEVKKYVVDVPSETLWVFTETETITFRLKSIAFCCYQWVEVEEW
jgi:hypothetical protein